MVGEYQARWLLVGCNQLKSTRYGCCVSADESGGVGVIVQRPLQVELWQLQLLQSLCSWT